MWKRPLTFADWQTPAQRASQLAAWRHDDTCRVGINNKLGIWRECRQRGCRRRHSCEGDPHACYARFWAALPDDIKADIRAEFRAQIAAHAAR